MTKRFKIPADQIRSIAPRRGACIASDLITVQGKRVCYMVRGAPQDEVDSGWTFMAGTESDAYAADPKNFAVYDINTIANYDPDIVPLLGAPVGSSFERRRNRGPLVPCEGSVVPPEERPRWLPPGIPLVTGAYALSPHWTITLPEPYARRTEGRSLVLWRPGVTLWIAAFGNPNRTSRADQLAAARADMSAAATEVEVREEPTVTRLTYRTREDATDALNVRVLADDAQLIVSIYYDLPGDLAVARALADSLARSDARN